MKVIKPGREQKGWSIETTCTGKGNGDGGCGAVLLVEEKDLFITESHHHVDDDYFTTFKCMACEVLTDLDVPATIKAKLPKQTEWEAKLAELYDS